MDSRSSTTEPEKGTIQTIDHERVAEVAYRIYLGRGGADGHDLDDWLEAEAHLKPQIGSPGRRALL